MSFKKWITEVFRFKPMAVAVLVVLMLSVLCGFAACSGGGASRPAWPDIDGCEGAVIYAPEDFESAKDDWYGGEGELLSESASRDSLSNVSVGEEYYLIYTKTHIMDVVAMGKVEYSFRLRTENGVLERENCVEQGELFYDEDSEHVEWSVSEVLSWIYKNPSYVETEEGLDYILDYVFTYVVLPFTPLQTGQLVVECGEDSFSLNVTTAESAVGGEFAEISSVRMAIAEVGAQADLVFDAAIEEEVYSEREYFLYLDFDVTALETDSKRTFTCVVLREGNAADFQLEEAATNEFSKAKFGEKDALLLQFEIPQQIGQPETYRVVISIHVTGEGTESFEPVFLSSEGYLKGELHGAFCSLTAQKDELSDGRFEYRYLWETQSYAITDVHYFAASSLVIPDTYQGYPVSRIDDGVFERCNVLSVTLGSEITEIGNGAFSNNDLKQITFNRKLQKIEDSAFAGTSLEEIVLPDSLTSIGGMAFYNTNLRSVSFGENIREIGHSAFANCENLRGITWPASVPVMETSMFSYSGLQTIFFAGEMREIGEYAFSGCKDLKEIVWPSGIDSVADETFRESGLERITFDGDVQEIGDYAFAECESLEEIVLPVSLTSVGKLAFSQTPLQSILLPAGVSEIGAGAFECGRAAPAENIGDDKYIFEYTLQEFKVSLENAYYTAVEGVLFTKNMDVLVAYPKGNTRSAYTVPEGVTEIGKGAFAVEMADNDGVPAFALKSIVLPATLEKIGESAFNVWLRGFSEGEIVSMSQYESVLFTDGGNWGYQQWSVTAEELADAAEAARLLSLRYYYSWMREK